MIFFEFSAVSRQLSAMRSPPKPEC